MDTVVDLAVSAGVAAEVDVATEVDLTAAVLSGEEPDAALPWLAAPRDFAPAAAGTAVVDALGALAGVAGALGAAVRPALTGVGRPASTSENWSMPVVLSGVVAASVRAATLPETAPAGAVALTLHRAGAVPAHPTRAAHADPRLFYPRSAPCQ